MPNRSLPIVFCSALVMPAATASPTTSPPATPAPAAATPTPADAQRDRRCTPPAITGRIGRVISGVVGRVVIGRISGRISGRDVDRRLGLGVVLGGWRRRRRD